jgi:hypothetical protein
MFRMFQMRDAKGYAFGILFIINIGLWALAVFGCWVCIGLAVAAYRWGPQLRACAWLCVCICCMWAGVEGHCMACGIGADVSRTLGKANYMHWCTC